jgi:hypothetical protein
MSGAEAKDVQSNDRERPLDWRHDVGPHARPDAARLLRPLSARSRRHTCPLDATYAPTRGNIRAHSRQHTRPLDGAGVGGPVAYLTLTIATLEVCPLLRSIMRTRLAPRCASSTKLWNRPEPVVTAGKGNVIHRPCLRS